MSVAATLIVVRWVHFAASSMLFGLATFPAYVPALATERARATAILRWAAAACAFGTLASAVAWLSCEGASMSGDAAGAIDPATLRTVLDQTAFGAVWRLRLVLAAAAVPCWFVLGGSPRREARVVLAVLSGTILAMLALTGHPAAENDLPGVVHRLADALHVLAAGAWLGGLVAIAALLRLCGNLREGAAAAALARASALAPLPVAVLALAGIVDGSFTFGGWPELVGSAYGRVLLAKAVILVVMLALAVLNRRTVARLRSAPVREVRAFALVLGIEQVAGLAALLLAAVLGTLDPPGSVM